MTPFLSPAKADALQAVGHLQQQPDEAHDERGHQYFKMEGVAQHQQGHPQDGAGGGHHGVGLVGRLANLLLLRLVAALDPFFRKFMS